MLGAVHERLTGQVIYPGRGCRLRSGQGAEHLPGERVVCRTLGMANR